MSKNLIYICVFCNSKYIDLLNLLLNSIYKKGNLNSNTDILVYTTTEFMNIIKQTPENNKLLFQINDNYQTLEQSYFARTDVFNFHLISSYLKILYVDTDIIISGDLNTIFDILTTDELYVKPEKDNTIYTLYKDNTLDMFGNALFKHFEFTPTDIQALNSGVLLFYNSIIMKKLFNCINETNKNLPNQGITDQPYFNYCAKKMNLANTIKLDNYIILVMLNFEENINNIYNYQNNSNYIIWHFCGFHGEPFNKNKYMIEFSKNIGIL
jgi:lipopolysaccharide biosynthesis glycosyltransferase